MATNVFILLFCLVAILLLLKESHAMVVVATSESPAPAPAPGPGPAPAPAPTRPGPAPAPQSNKVRLLRCRKCLSKLIIKKRSMYNFDVFVLLSHRMAPLRAVLNHKIVVLVVRIDAQTHSTRSHVCSSAKSVVRNACVCPLEPMATRRYAPATTTGRPKGEDPNALESSTSLFFSIAAVTSISLVLYHSLI
ncbi:hypothetical protein VNO80_14472 [Phaseolus coccineus]|uniref:Uncharacterized protein n=1 Tax=Phaseolus coccineus TaxID=3886 RepID=A0AAN9MNG1_PHACN